MMKTDTFKSSWTGLMPIRWFGGRHGSPSRPRTPRRGAPILVRTAALAVTFAVLGLFPAHAGILNWIFPKAEVQVIAVTDTTPAGALRRPVTPANPVYYMAVSAGYRDFGGIIAGDKIPAKDEMLKAIAKVLAKQGYLPATDENPPTLLLFWTWGTMNADRMVTMNGDEGPQTNRRQLLRFMGAYKLGLISKEKSGFQDELGMNGVLFRDADQDMIYELASEDLYVAAISAYDYAAAKRSEKTLLWMTKIACPSRRLAMNETLPVMLTLAGPHIGRDTAKPVSIKAADKLKPEVRIGDPTVVEYMEKTKVPVLEVEPPAASKKKQAAPKVTPKR